MREAVVRLSRNHVGLLAGVFVLVLVILAVAAPWIAVYQPNQISNSVLSPPAVAHPFGTDELGRDGLSNLVYGSRIALAVGISSALAATILGLLIGAAAGYYGGIPDLALMRFTEIFQVMPAFILAALIVALLGAGLTTVILVIALLAWPQIARVMRSEVLRLKAMDYVAAGRCLGLTDTEVIWGEIVPNALGPIVSLASLIVAQAIILEAGLSYLGLSDPSVPSWGKMLNDGQQYLSQAWWMSIFPGLALLITVVAFNVLGDALQGAFDPVLQASGQR
jgi:peptide/nickel transport system permease protein